MLRLQLPATFQAGGLLQAAARVFEPKNKKTKKITTKKMVFFLSNIFDSSKFIFSYFTTFENKNKNSGTLPELNFVNRNSEN